MGDEPLAATFSTAMFVEEQWLLAGLVYATMVAESVSYTTGAVRMALFETCST
jgi:hypothetical protein